MAEEDQPLKVTRVIDCRIPLPWLLSGLIIVGWAAFQLRAQLYFTTTRYVRVNLGWKLTWAADRVQIATHINPFRVWKN